MPISRVMNNPDGSTPTPVMGGGDVNGTLARSILMLHAGTAAQQIDQPRHIVAQTTTMGVPSSVVTQEQIPVVGASEVGMTSNAA